MLLKSGRTVLHRPMLNGATEAYFADESPMTSDEWAEYAERVRTDCKAEAQDRTSQRIAESKARFELDKANGRNTRPVW